MMMTLIHHMKGSGTERGHVDSHRTDRERGREGGERRGRRGLRGGRERGYEGGR